MEHFLDEPILQLGHFHNVSQVACEPIDTSLQKFGSFLAFDEFPLFLFTPSNIFDDSVHTLELSGHKNRHERNTDDLLADFRLLQSGASIF
jgi:hypothetical protein